MESAKAINNNVLKMKDNLNSMNANLEKYITTLKNLLNIDSLNLETKNKIKMALTKATNFKIDFNADYKKFIKLLEIVASDYEQLRKDANKAYNDLISSFKSIVK